MFLPSQLPTETDVIDGNGLELKELKCEMASPPSLQELLPGSPAPPGWNNNHRNHSPEALALWISPDLAVVTMRPINLGFFLYGFSMGCLQQQHPELCPHSSAGFDPQAHEREIKPSETTLQHYMPSFYFPEGTKTQGAF